MTLGPITAATPVDDRERSWAETLKAHHRRVTKQRMAVMRATAASSHASAEQIHKYASEALPQLALSTTHMILHDLTNVRLLRRVEVPNSPTLYEVETGDNHHHVQCVKCGRLEDVECALGHAPCLEPSHTHGIDIDVAEVLYRGLCEDCKEA